MDKKIIKIILLLQVIIIIGIFILFSRVSEEDYRFKLNEISGKLENLSSEIRSLEDNIEQKNSLLSDSYSEFGKMDWDTLKYPLSFVVVPKEYSEDTKVYLELDGKELEMKKEASSYKLSLEGDAKRDYIPGKVIIEKDGNYKSQVLETKNKLWVEDFLFNMIPEIKLEQGGERTIEGFTIKYNNELIVHGYNDKEISRFGMKRLRVDSLKCEIRINDKTVDTIDFKAQGKDEKAESGTLTANIDKPYELKEGDSIKMVLLATLEKGFSFEEILDFYDTKNPDADMNYESNLNGKIKLLDKEGNTVMEEEGF